MTAGAGQEPEAGAGGHGPRVLWRVAACLPATALLVWFVVRYHYTAPFGEQWGLVPLYAKLGSGTLTFDDLWRQKNVHRIFFPKLLLFGLARWGGWSHLRETLAGCALGLIGLAGVLFALAPAMGRLRRGAFLGWTLVTSAFVLSLAQSENWLWGIQVQLLTCQAALVWGVCLLARARNGWHVGAAALCGVVASFSYSSGLAFWPVGLVTLWLAPGLTRGRRRALALAWALGAALCVAVFLRGYQPGDGAALSALGDPLRALAYLLAYLGNPVATDTTWALAASAGALVLCAGLLRLHRARGTPREETLPALALLLLALAVGALVCAGRVGLPLTQALSSRYVTFANLLWLGLIGLSLGGLPRGPAAAGARSVWSSAAMLAVLAVLLVGGTLRSVRGYQNGVAFSRRVAWAASVVLETYPRVPPPALLGLNSNRPEVVQKHLPLLERGRLSLFAGEREPGERRRAPRGRRRR